MIHLRAGDYRRMPWKNGGGVTTEIARRDGADGELDWRVSIAEVATDGPFSRFPGVDRVIVVVEGAGMVLAHAGEERRVSLGPLEPYAFPGDLDTDCTLPAGPIRDFNLMTRRGRWRGEVVVTRAEAAGVELSLPRDAALVHCVAGRVLVRGDGGEATLAAGETLLAEHREGGLAIARSLAGPARLLVVTLAEAGAE